MPWLRSRTERSSGLTTWSIEWREGKKVRHRVLGPVTEQEAQYELAAMNAGKRTRQAKRTVDPARAVEDYLRHLKAAGRREGTVAHDRDKLKPLLDEWGHRPLADWSRPHLEALLTERAWAPTRVRNALGVYRRFIAWCDQVGITCGDFVAGFKPPRARPAEEREALSPEQCRKLLDASRDHALEVPVALALFAGLSRADLRAITWAEPVAVLRVPGRGALGVDDPPAGREGLRLPLPRVLDEVLVDREEAGVDPLLHEGGGRALELQVVAVVVRAGRVRERADRGVREEDDLHAALGPQAIEGGEELSPLDERHRVTATVAGVLDRLPTVLLTDGVVDQRLDPVDRVDDQGLVLVGLGREDPDGVEDVREARRLGEARDVEVADPGLRASMEEMWEIDLSSTRGRIPDQAALRADIDALYRGYEGESWPKDDGFSVHYTRLIREYEVDGRKVGEYDDLEFEYSESEFRKSNVVPLGRHMPSAAHSLGSFLDLVERHFGNFFVFTDAEMLPLGRDALMRSYP